MRVNLNKTLTWHPLNIFSLYLSRSFLQLCTDESFFKNLKVAAIYCCKWGIFMHNVTIFLHNDLGKPMVKSYFNLLAFINYFLFLIVFIPVNIWLHNPRSIIKIFFPSKYPFLLLRTFKLWRIRASSAESWKFQPHLTDKNRSSLTNCWGVVCQAQLDLPAFLSSGYLPFEIPPGMKINWGQARMRPRAVVASAALCALFWVYSAYPWQVMPEQISGRRCLSAV